MRLLAAIRERDMGPERQIIAVVVGIIGKAAMLDHQLSGMRRIAPGIPALRCAAGQFAEDLDSGTQMRALRVDIDVLVVNPEQTMAGDFMPELDKCLGQLGMSLQGHRHAKYGQWQLTLFELAQDAPDADTRPIFVDRFHREVTRRIGCSTNNFGKKLLRRWVAMQYRVFATFFIIENKLDSDLGLSRPVGMRDLTAVANQVAWIVVACLHVL